MDKAIQSILQKIEGKKNVSVDSFLAHYDDEFGSVNLYINAVLEVLRQHYTLTLQYHHPAVGDIFSISPIR